VTLSTCWLRKSQVNLSMHTIILLLLAFLGCTINALGFSWMHDHAHSNKPSRTLARFLLAQSPQAVARFPVAARKFDSRMVAFEEFAEFLASGSDATTAQAKPISTVQAEPNQADESVSSAFLHAPLSYFSLDKLTGKGPRANADIGAPEDFTRPLAKVNEVGCGGSVGSWACTEGGWPSPKLRPTTEFFIVLDGAGTLTDLDGTAHHFGAGDIVVLPKHWSGRWDITQHIHKVWCVHDHPDVPGAADGIVRVVVAPVALFFAPFHVKDTLPRVAEHALHGSPSITEHIVYDVGPTYVGLWSCSPGSFAVTARPSAQCFFVVDGVFFLTNSDGSARRCTSGDTVVLPKGWSGHWDIISPVRTIKVEVS